MFQLYQFTEKTRVHNLYLEDGGVCLMHSRDTGHNDTSFQRLAKHQVPVYKGAKGWRLNWTIRTTASPLEPKLESYKQEIHIGEGLSLRLKKVDYDPLLKVELLADLQKYGHADVTTVFGKTHTNNGRLVLEQSMQDGQTYTYSGKTTPPGKAFGPRALAFIQEVAARDFNVTPDKLWAHVIFYPDPATCGLGWHSDSEAGINPNMIMSVTFLEDPKGGIRPFQVRLKSDVTDKKEANKNKKKQKLQPISEFFKN
jgi:alkylated DNA repair dioxygenase AlkB